MSTTAPHIKKAVIPAAGLGTRFLPATKATPKEMLPVVDKPAIQYVVEEAVAAHLDDLLVITGRNKRSLEDHFDRAPDLEGSLEAKGDTNKLQAVRHTTDMVNIHYVRQGDPHGLGHAVLRAKTHICDEPFVVLLGDDLIDPRDLLLSRMIEVQRQKGGSVVALIEVPQEQVSAYGCVEAEPTSNDGVVKVRRLVEKPSIEDAPSNLAIIGRYVLHPCVFEILEATPPGRGGEIQLTDALQSLAVAEGEGAGVHGLIFSGRRYDTGDKLSYLKAVVTLGCDNEEVGPALRSWLRSFSNGLQ